MSSQSDSIQLRKHATLLMLWGLGVGAVISGDFFGWQYGLQQGGFVGMLLALLLVLAMYTCLIFSIAELSAAMPNAGGFYLFAKQAFGHFAGYFCGILVCIEYIITAAIIVVGISHYMHLLFPAIPVYLWWVGFYVIFAGVNIIGVGMTLELMVLITCISIAILVFFYASVLGTHAFHWHNLLNVTPSTGFTHWLPHGWLGALTAIPNAIWLFLAIEELPMAAEETRNAARVLPKALLVCLITLASLALLTLFLNSGVGGGAAVMGHSDAPLYAGFLSVLHHHAWMPWLNCFMLIGLITSFNGIIFGFGRIIFALSREGFLPKQLSVLNRFHSPHRAVITGSLIGLLLAFAMYFLKVKAIGEMLINMGIFAAVLSYSIVLIAYIRLRVFSRELNRPYKSPLGVAGAFVGFLLALLAWLATLLNPAVRMGIVGLFVLMVIAVVYYYGSNSRDNNSDFKSAFDL